VLRALEDFERGGGVGGDVECEGDAAGVEDKGRVVLRMDAGQGVGRPGESFVSFEERRHLYNNKINK